MRPTQLIDHTLVSTNLNNSARQNSAHPKGATNLHRWRERFLKRSGFFLAALLCVGALTATFVYNRAQADTPVMVEDFSYSTGQLTNTNGGANVSGGNWVGISGTTLTLVQVTSPGLTYSGYPGSGVGNKIDILTGASATEDIARSFTAQTGTAYFAFLLNVANTTGLTANSSTVGDHFGGFVDSATTTNFVGRISIRAGSVAGTFNIGVRHSTTNAAAAFYTTDLPVATTHLIVLKYEQPAGNLNNIASIFVNPATGGAEPAAQVSQTSLMPTEPANVGKVYFREATNSPNASIDGIRVGASWDGATATPTITVVGGPLAFPNTAVGGTSAEQTYTVSGTNLAANITVTAPSTDFQVSATTGAGFGPSVTFTQTAGTVATQTVYVRFTPQSAGPLGGNITNASTGATTQNVAVSGTGVAPCVPPATVYVDDNWVATTPGTDPDAGGPATNFGCDSFATIQDGINGVTSGGTVIVRAGTYPESVLANKPVTLQGAQAGQDANTRFAAFIAGGPPNGPKADPAVESVITAAAVNPTSNVNNAVHVNADDVTIDGFVVDGNNPALSPTGAVVIGGINTDSRRGIQTETAAGVFFPANNVRVQYNVVQNFAQRGIQLINGPDSATAPATSGSLIDANLVRNFGVNGIVLFFNAHADISNNTVVAGAYPDVEAGIWIQDFLDKGTPIPITVEDNNVTVGQDNFAGIWVNLAYISTLNINDNTINAAAGVTGASDFTYGIYLASQRPNSAANLNGNTVGATGGEFARGISLWNLGSATPTTVTGGTVGNSLKGLTLHVNDPNFGLAGNNSEVETSGVSIDGTGVTGDVGIFVDATSSTGDTVGMEIFGDTSIVNTTTAISVVGANASSHIHDNSASIHDNTTGIEVNGGSANIVSNNLYANTTGLRFGGASVSITAHINRIISTTTAIDNPNNLTANLENNWWGCNAGPGNTGCGAVTGTGADFDPWIVLGVSASPNSITAGGTSTVTADMTMNSAGGTYVGTLPDMPVAWSATEGTMSPTSGTITAGMATSQFTSTSNNSGTGCATVDNQLTCAPITVTAAPCVPPSTVYVDDDWAAVTPGTDPDAGGPATNFGCDSFATIQGGIDGVASGGTVIVSAGTYTQASSINLNKSLVLRGPNYLISPNGGVRVAEALITGPPSTVLRISAPGSPVTIEGFRFDSAGVVDNYDPAMTITIRKNIYSNGISNGAFYFLNAPALLTFDDNYLTAPALADEDSMFIAGNWNGTTGTAVSITNNVWENALSTGINASSISGTISGNRFTNFPYYAILLANSSGSLTIQSNIFDQISNPDPVNVPTWGAGIRFFTPTFVGAVNIKSNTFTDNYVGVGVRASGGDLTGQDIHVNFNRFVGNNFGIRHDGTGPLESQNNWWGCNAGPGMSGCDSISEAGAGNVDFDPWIVLGVSASPIPIAPGGSSTVTADMTHNSAGTDTSASGTVPSMPVAWSAMEGTMSPTSGTITGGAATSTFTSNSSNSGSGCATVDSQLVCTPIQVVTPVTVSLPHVTGPTGSNISVPITVGDLTGKSVKSYDFQITFDPTRVQPLAVPYDTTGTISSGMTVTYDISNPGHLILSASQATDLTGSGTLIKVLFNIVGAPGQSTPTTFEDYTDPGTVFHPGFRFNAVAPVATTSNGSISVNGPTAADGTVSGRIVDGNGNAVEGAAIRLTGTQTRLTVTDREGNYHFENVETSGFYTVSPTRPNFIFNPSARSFSQLGANTEAGFSATDAAGGLSPLDETVYFVRQQYVDFLGREPDEAGLNFWVNSINVCGSDSDCLAARRIDTSAAFFLSIEFEQTGFLVHRMYQAAYGDMPGAPVPLRRSEFNPDKLKIGDAVVVNQRGWEAKLEANTKAFAQEFVQRTRFASSYPASLAPAAFVDRLFLNAGVAPAQNERAAAIAEFGDATDTADSAARARALRRVADNAQLRQQEFGQAFVLMQYFGYLGRDPNNGPDADFSGYSFWLNKLESFNGDYRSAEMVKAFLVAGEYRGRFPR